MAGPSPHEIWESGLDEGERRLARRPAVLAATGLTGGLDVMLGILALIITTGAMSAIVPDRTAHVIGSFTFGLAFVFIAIGRSELFTENFLIPIAALFEKRGRPVQLARMWAITLAANLVGLAALSALLSIDGVLEQDALNAAGKLADTYADRTLLPAFVSAVVAGTVMTLFTWLVQAAERDITRLVLALLIGFLLAAPSLNHAVVSFGEVLLGIVAGTASAGLQDLAQNLGVSIAGNLLGGLGFVTYSRLVQARGPGTS